MDERTVKQAAQMWALVAEMEAIKAEITGMVVSNAERLNQGLAAAWSESVFDEARDELLEIAQRLRDEI